jgi:hypothetical protein
MTQGLSIVEMFRINFRKFVILKIWRGIDLEGLWPFPAWTATNQEYLDKSLKVMVDAEGFEPTTR